MNFFTDFISGVATDPVDRNPELQQQIDDACTRLALYHFPACPYCIRVRRSIEHLALKIELRDIYSGDQYGQELMQGGGSGMVPCLRIEDENGDIRWMYESADIVNYLNGRFG